MSDALIAARAQGSILEREIRGRSGRRGRGGGRAVSFYCGGASTRVCVCVSVCAFERASERVWREAAAPVLSSPLAPSDIKRGCGGFSAAAAASSAATQTRTRRQARKYSAVAPRSAAYISGTSAHSLRPHIERLALVRGASVPPVLSACLPACLDSARGIPPPEGVEVGPR